MCTKAMVIRAPVPHFGGRGIHDKLTVLKQNSFKTELKIRSARLRIKYCVGFRSDGRRGHSDRHGRQHNTRQPRLAVAYVPIF